MNIAKRINIHHLLTLPFILVPLLVTHRFQDPTLLIKRSGVFFLFAIIVLILVSMKSCQTLLSEGTSVSTFPYWCTDKLHDTTGRTGRADIGTLNKTLSF